MTRILAIASGRRKYPAGLILLFCFVVLLLSCASSEKALNDPDCSTRYPILLVHGIAARDEWDFLGYWGRIERQLKTSGADVYLSGQNAFDTHEDNARMIAEKMRRIMEKHPEIEKFNIVAHSKGGIESRYLISKLGMAPYVASLTTLCTPHRGSAIADLAIETLFKKWLPNNKLIPSAVDFAAFLLGDDSPDAYESWENLTSSYMKEFNRDVQDQPGIYYQSWAAVMDKTYPAVSPVLLHNYIYKKEGANDGLVSLESARWGVFRGIVPDKGIEGGVSHADMVEKNSRGDNLHFDAASFYVSVVSELKEMGF